jgi:hypothetical protein
VDHYFNKEDTMKHILAITALFILILDAPLSMDGSPVVVDWKHPGPPVYRSKAYLCQSNHYFYTTAGWYRMELEKQTWEWAPVKVGSPIWKQLEAFREDR